MLRQFNPESKTRLVRRKPRYLTSSNRPEERSLKDKKRVFRKRDVANEARSLAVSCERSLHREFRRDKSYLAGRPLEFGAHADNECEITRARNTFGTGSGRDSHDVERQASTPQKPSYRVPRSRWPRYNVHISVCCRQSSLKIVQRNRGTWLVFFAISRYDDVDHALFFRALAR